MNTEELLNILTYYHLQEFPSGTELIQGLQEDDYDRQFVVLSGRIKLSTFFDTVNDHGVEQHLVVFTEMQKQVVGILLSQYSALSYLVAIEGSLIDSVLSMHWAGYRTNSKKAKIHLGLNLNHGVPRKLFLTEGNGAERPFISKINVPSQTGVLPQWQQDQCHFVCRIKEATRQDVLEEYHVSKDSSVFFGAKVLLETPKVDQTKPPVRLVGYIIEGISYWIATDCVDISTEQVALIYKLRWNIEPFFAWWKRHVEVYPLFVRSKKSLMIQIISDLITYVLLAIYCHEQHKEPVSIRRVRQLRNQIRNEANLNLL